MKIHYMSDLHVDHFIFDPNKVTKRNKQIDEYFKLTKIYKIPEDERYMFIIAGDLSNSNTVAKVFLKRLKELFKYVLIVPGNHDLYLTSSSQAAKYKFNSFNRITEMKEFCLENNIYYLDGQIIEIDGKKFGGLSMFWDKSYYNYLEKREASDGEVLNFYDNYMNDSKCIMDGFEPYSVPTAYGGKYFKSSFNAFTYFESEYIKLQNFNNFDNIDVMITHYTPTIPYGIRTTYALEKGSTFYMFNGEKDIERIQPKFWLFGHMHDKFDFIHKDVRFLCNPNGYPGETTYTVDSFEL
jgi:Icc-related predicted phosphoesterase